MKRIIRKFDKVAVLAAVMGGLGAFSFTAAQEPRQEVLWGRTQQGWVELGPSNPESNYTCNLASDICKASYEEGATPVSGEGDAGFIRTEDTGVLVPN